MRRTYLERYVQELAQTTGAHQHIRYNTRVEAVGKKSTSSSADDIATHWTVKTRALIRAPESRYRDGKAGDDGGFLRFVSETRHFDAVVVASGHYNEPRGRGLFSHPLYFSRSFFLYIFLSKVN